MRVSTERLREIVTKGVKFAQGGELEVSMAMDLLEAREKLEKVEKLILTYKKAYEGRDASPWNRC